MIMFIIGFVVGFIVCTGLAVVVVTLITDEFSGKDDSPSDRPLTYREMQHHRRDPAEGSR